MKIILDENIPWPLSRFLSGHEVTSVQRQGWAGVQNGEFIMSDYEYENDLCATGALRARVETH